MVKSIYDTFSYEERNSFFKEKVIALANANNVDILEVCEDEMDRYYYQYGRPSVSGVFIINGNIHYCIRDNQTVSFELMFHELLHILSVPPKYRHLMCVDTQESYKNIKKVYNDKRRICTESAVLGAQSIIYKRINVSGWLGGSFFKGYLRKYDQNNSTMSTDVDLEWRKRGNLLLASINWKCIL